MLEKSSTAGSDRVPVIQDPVRVEPVKREPKTTSALPDKIGASRR